MIGSRSARRAAGMFISTTAGVAVIAIMSMVGNKVPSNVFTPRGPEGATKSVSAVFLQGWGFFTRDAREDRVSIAAKRSTTLKWETLDQDAIVQPKYAFGLSRASRAESVDINVLYSALDDDIEWVECDPRKALGDCLDKLEPVVRANLAPLELEPLCSSKLALVRETPIPYGYRDLTRAKQTSAVAIAVDCHG